MSETARVILAIPDDGRAAHLEQAVAAAGIRSVIVVVHDRASFLAAHAHDASNLLLLDADFDDDVFSLIDVAFATRHVRSAVMFKRADDERRTQAALRGLIDFVGTGKAPDPTLTALVSRLLTREMLQSRLDDTRLRFDTLVENSTDGIYILKGPRFAWANRRFESMVGFQLEELLGDGFSIDEKIISEESLPSLQARLRRVQAGLPVEPRYEFLACRKDGSTFDAQVSISYIQFEGAPAALGIMQDITERKRFESQLVRKNRELALLNELSTAVNAKVETVPLLDVGCRRAHEILKVTATGIALVSADESVLELRAHVGLDDAMVETLRRVPVDGGSLLAAALRSGDVHVVTDLKHDPRIEIPAVRNAGYRAATVVPVKAESRTLGAMFVFVGDDKEITDDDRDLLLAIGTLLGTAVEKARLLENERAAVDRLTTVDDIALAVASELEAKLIAEAVAGIIEENYRPAFIMIAEHNVDDDEICALTTRLFGATVPTSPRIPRGGSLIGHAMASGKVEVRTRDEPSPVLHPAQQALFDHGIHTLVAVPAIAGGHATGGLVVGWLEPVATDVFPALRAIGSHVAVAFKNAALFAARERALDELKTAQMKLLQSERLRALGELAAGVAHDFNNVLGAILGRAQLLKSQSSDPSVIKHADIIERSASDGAETVRRIQEIGRQETTDDFVVIDLSALLSDVKDMTQPRWGDLPAREGRPITLVVGGPEHPVTILGKPSEIREVLINLVHNAVDAMPNGGEVSLLVHEVDDDTCEVHVKDTGLGIPEEVRARIFEPFFTTKGDKGTGLGLAVSYSIVGRHKGELSVSSATGDDHGTCFTLSFPRHHAQVSTSVPLMPVESAAGRGAARILVIDDEENIREILADILSTGGYDVVTAESGDAGLLLLETTPCDLVFTDLSLPGMNGYEVAEAIRDRFPTTPIGLVTGWGATIDPEKARAHGVHVILPKPFKFDQVLSTVADTLARNRS